MLRSKSDRAAGPEVPRAAVTVVGSPVASPWSSGSTVTPFLIRVRTV